MRKYTKPTKTTPPNKQNKIPLITKPNPNHIYPITFIGTQPYTHNQYPPPKQNKILIALTKPYIIKPLTILHTNHIIHNQYIPIHIKVPHRGFWGFRQTRLGKLTLLYKATQLTI